MLNMEADVENGEIFFPFLFYDRSLQNCLNIDDKTGSL